MSFFGIIFYIVIIVIFINAKKAAQSGKDGTRSHNRSNLSGNYSGKKTYSSSKGILATPNVPKQEKGTITNVAKNNRNNIPNVPKIGRTARPNVPENGKTAIPNVPMKKKSERTFMEPHKEENLQPKIKTNHLWGEDEHANQRIVALRLMEGDPVPEGYVKIRCPYCAADNLVTKRCKEYHSCYFCRVPID